MRTRTFRAALLAMVAVGMLFSLGVSTAIADPTGVIQGHVTDSVTGLPIGGACIVHLWNTTTWGYYDYVGLDSDGFYRFEGLSAGNYMCWISDTGTPPNHIEYNPTTQVDPPFAVLASDDSSVTVDVTMHPYGHIKGHVSAKTGGQPLAGITASARRWVNGKQVAGGYSGLTDANGDYDIGILKPGTYRLGFEDPNAHDDPPNAYESLVWPDINCQFVADDPLSQGQDVTIASDGEIVTGKDAQLTHFSRIHLHTVDASGTPQTTYTWSDYLDPAQGWVGWHSQYCYGDTYLANCLVGGRYKIQNHDYTGTWMHSYYPATMLWSEATTITIADEGATYEVTQTIFPESVVSGRVTAAQTATGVPNAQVSVEMLDSGEWVTPTYEWAQTGATADAMGNWTLSLGPGIYRLHFADSGGQLEPSYLTAFGEPTTTVVAIAVDRVGVDQALMPLDSLAPTTTATFSAAWSKEATMSLTATDGPWGSGVASTWYGVGSQVVTLAYTPGDVIHVSAEGTQTVYFGSVDRAGHHEAARTATVHVDHSAPTVAAIITQSVGEATVSLVASDALSGLTGISYHVGGSAEATYTTPLHLKPGSYQVSYRATDLVGNRSDSELATVVVPLVAPNLTTPSISPSKPKHNKTFTIAGKIRIADSVKKTIVLTVQRKVSGKWKPYATVKATLAAGATSYSVKTKVSKKASYQVRAYHAKDSFHLAGYSKWKAFSAK